MVPWFVFSLVNVGLGRKSGRLRVPQSQIRWNFQDSLNANIYLKYLCSCLDFFSHFEVAAASVVVPIWSCVLTKTHPIVRRIWLVNIIHTSTEVSISLGEFLNCGQFTRGPKLLRPKTKRKPIRVSNRQRKTHMGSKTGGKNPFGFSHWVKLGNLFSPFFSQVPRGL